MKRTRYNIALDFFENNAASLEVTRIDYQTNAVEILGAAVFRDHFVALDQVERYLTAVATAIRLARS